MSEAETLEEGPDYQAMAREVWEPVSTPDMGGWMVNRAKKPQVYRSPAGEILTLAAYGAHVKRVRRALERREESAAPVAALSPVDLPEPTIDRPHAETKKAGLATPAELAETAWLALLLATLILGFLLRAPEVAMTNDEAWAIATPIGNILERTTINRRYGRWLRDGGDYMKLGYAGVMYTVRVSWAMQYRQQLQAQGQGQSRPAAPATPVPTPPTPTAQNGARPEQPGPARSLPFSPRAGGIQ